MIKMLYRNQDINHWSNNKIKKWARLKWSKYQN